MHIYSNPSRASALLRSSQSLGVLLACLAAVTLVARAASATMVFSLESAKNARVYGPFEYENGKRVILGDEAYRVGVPEERRVTFASEATGAVLGPYDLVDGRLVKIGDSMYTVLDVREVATAAEAPAAPVPQPAPEPPAAAVPPAVPVVIPPRPPEPPAPIDVKVAPEPVRPSPLREPAPVAEPAAGPVVRAVPPPAAPRPPPTAPLPRSASVGISVPSTAEYDWTIEGLPGTTATSIRRNAMFLGASRGGAAVEVGFVYDAEAEDTVPAGSGALFDDVELKDGQGWWVTLRYGFDAWRRGTWALHLSGDGTFRRETYALRYGAWSSSQTVVGTVASNNAQVVQTSWRYADEETDAVLLETFARAAVELRHTVGQWDMWAGARALAVANGDVSGDVTDANGDHKIELERTAVVNGAAGFGRTRAGMRWFAEVEAGGDMDLRAGLQRRF